MALWNGRGSRSGTARAAGFVRKERKVLVAAQMERGGGLPLLERTECLRQQAPHALSAPSGDWSRSSTSQNSPLGHRGAFCPSRGHAEHTMGPLGP